MSKLLFLSYAHTNDDVYLRKFVQELGDEVLPLVKGLSRDDIVFFDRESIKTGDDWRKRIGPAATACKVLIAVCSPAFSDSEFCGKELAVFLQRIQEWEKLSANAGVADRPIISVLWVADSLPSPLKPYQSNDDTLPGVYKTVGLRLMYRLTKYRAKRTEVVSALAARIAALVKCVDLPPLPGIPHFDQIKSAFDKPRGSTQYGVAVLPLFHHGIHSAPFPDGATLRTLIDKAYTERIPWRALEGDKSVAEKLLDSQMQREVTVVITDFKVLTDPLYQQLLSAAGRGMGARTQLVVVMSSAQVDPQNARITLTGAFGFAESPRISFVASREEFLTKLETETARSRNALIAEDPAKEVVDLQLEAAARTEGIQAMSQPTLVGPSGGTR